MKAAHRALRSVNGTVLLAAPLPGIRSNAGMRALRAADGPIVFAHAELSGFSVFEEAAWWGCEAARKVLA